MNFSEKTAELLPLVLLWNGEIQRFLAREPSQKQLAVTY
jgi:hypothetical protein